MRTLRHEVSTIRGVVCGMLVFVGVLCAQGTSGNITGQVLDPTGAAIPGARVVATNSATNVSTATSSTETGNYNLVVYPGVFRVEVEAGGFKRYVREKVTVTAAATVRVDPVLELGALTESVQVTGSLLTVQSENARVSTAVENKFVDELPLVVGGTLRNPYDLVQIAPQVLKRGADNVSLGGASARSWNATLDGLSIITNRSAEAEVAFMAPSLEAITEFAVDTGGFKAEYGQASGGILTFSSKSGTNDFHGTAYEFLRNEKLDARAFFERQKSVYKQHDFGLAGGGPVVIPKLYSGRNRSFFYVTYEGFRNRAGANAIIQSVPTPEMYDGDFSYWVDRNGNRLQIYDPATTRANPSGSGFIRDAFAGNRIPKTRFSQFTQKIIPYAQGVKPNRAGQPGTLDYVRNNFIVTSGTILEPQDKGSAKIDHMLTESHRFGFFMNVTSYRREIGGGGPPGLPVPLYTGEVQTFDTRAYRLTYDWMISSTLLNHFQIGGNLFAKMSFSPNYGKGWKDKLCFANVVDCNRNFPIVSFSEFSSWGGNSANGTEQPMWSLKDDFNYTHGRHAFKMGFTYQDQTAVGFGEQTIAGSASFNFLGTSVPGNTTFTSGSSFASFLLGDAQSGTTETVRDIGQIYPYYGFYAQDDWRISKRLTLNLGVRYDFTLPPREALDQFSDFTPERPNTKVNNYPGALRFAGFGPGRENRRSLVPGWYRGVGPRFGLAYGLDSKTTLRTAFGRSFSRVTVSRGSGHYAGFIGSYGFSSLDAGITPAFNWDKGLPAYPLPITMDPKAQLDPTFSNNQSVSYWLPTDAARASENLYWTFNLQREIAPNTVLEIGYNATIGTHLMAYLQILNQVPTAVWNNYVQRYGASGARDLLRSDINSRAARDANVPIPYANFADAKVQSIRTVAQALRPYPQYLGISTGGDGDKSGHSSYHSLIVKASRRYSNGLAFEWNYVLSKLLADSDNFYDDATTQDQYNRRLEKSIGEFDQTHALKFSTVYELPFGRGRRFLAARHGAVQLLLGGWRLSAIQTYASGFPMRLSRNNPLPISNNDTRPVITSYDTWRGPIRGDKFDPAVDRFMNRDGFPAQPIGFGNATRYSPQLRSFPTFNENIGLAKRFAITERFQLDFRWEAFNLFNRTVFGTGSGNLDSAAFGTVTSQENDPRRMQAGLKLYW